MWVEQHGWGGDGTSGSIVFLPHTFAKLIVRRVAFSSQLRTFSATEVSSFLFFFAYSSDDHLSFYSALPVTVQASTDSSYLGASGSNPDSNQFEGDPSHVAEGQTMIATVTTTFTVPSGFSYSSHSSTTSREHASSRGSSDRPSSFSSTSPSSSPSSSPLPPSSSSKPNIGAIAGGEAEGGFALLSALALFFWRKRNRRRDQGQLEKFGLGGSSEDVEEGGYPPSSLTEVNAFNGVLAVPEVEPWTYTAPSTLLCDPFGRVDDEI